MNSRTTRSFWKHFEALPDSVRGQAQKAFRLWRDDTVHPGLHFKRVHGGEPIYAVRVSRGYRAFGLLDGDTVTGFWIGSHDDYERLIS